MLIIHISPFGLNLLLLKLKIENWKDCNKIIFKCVNSTVWPFLIFLVCEQWFLSPVQWTHVKLLFTRGEKKGGGNVKHGCSFQWNPNGLIIYKDTRSHIVTVWIQGFLQNPAVRFPFFFFLLSCVSGREETNFTVHETNVTVHALFWYCLCTVNGIHNHFIF